MKTFIIFLFSCAGVFGAETGIRVVSMGQTNVGYTGVYAKDVFTRDGQTNLIHITKINAAGTVLHIYHFYHAGQLVGNFVAFPDDHTFNTEAALYCMSLKSGPTGEIRSVRIGDKEGHLVDEFSCTNGIFSPVEHLLRPNGLMKPKFADIKDVGGSETRFKKQAAGKEGPTSQ